MTLADFHATYLKEWDNTFKVAYYDHNNGITGTMFRRNSILDERIEIRISVWPNQDLATAERRAHAVLAMCEWMRRVQKGEV